MVLAFLNPDNIQVDLLRDGAFKVNEPELEFLKDERDFLDAEAILLQRALIAKSAENAIITMQPLIQREIIRRMSNDEREKLFSLVVSILSANFPDTYSVDVGHQVAYWKHCERSLPHIESLIKQNEHFKIFENLNQPFAELLLRCSWENYSIAMSYIDIALHKFADKNSLAYASVVDLRGLINLDICRPAIALEEFEEAYKIRAAILAKDDVFLAASQVNLGLAFTELGQFEKAQDYLQQSIDLRLSHNSDRIGNSYSNMASLFLRMNKPDEAESMLKSCPSLKDFSDETFLQTGNPRFSGDMVLLSRIRLMQGRVDEALRLASKALGFRECLGERLKVCDSLYQVAVLLHETGNSVSATELLEECIKISEKLPPVEGTGHLARAHFRLSQILKSLGNEKGSEDHLVRARSLKKDFQKIVNHDVLLKEGTSESEDFENLVPWMLW